MKTRLPMIVTSTTAIAMLLAACGGAQSDSPSDPVAAEVVEVQSAEVEEIEPAESVDADAGAEADADAIDFDAISEADSELWSLMLRAEEAQGATREALLTKVDDDLNALTDMVLSAMDTSVASLDFEGISEADSAAWSLILRAGEAEELIDVAPVAQRILDGLDQSAAALVTTAGPDDAEETDSALWSLNLRIEEAQDLLDSSTN